MHNNVHLSQNCTQGTELRNTNRKNKQIDASLN